MGQMGLVGHIRPNVPLYSAVNIHVTQTSSLWPQNFFENICNRISPRGTYSLNVRCSLKAGYEVENHWAPPRVIPRADDGPALGRPAPDYGNTVIHSAF